jgi:hypothetical protein
MFHNLKDIADAVAERISGMDECPFRKVSVSHATDAGMLLEHVKSMAAWPSATVLIGPGSFDESGNLRKFTVAIVAAAEFASGSEARAAALMSAMDALLAEFTPEAGKMPVLLDDLPGVVAMEPKGWSPAAGADRIAAFALEIDLTECQHTIEEGE